VVVKQSTQRSPF